MRMHPGEATFYGDAVMQFVEGSAVLNGEPVTWRTTGIYRVDVEHRWIREAWLVPLDSELFDRIWSSHRVTQYGFGDAMPAAGQRRRLPPLAR